VLLLWNNAVWESRRKAVLEQNATTIEFEVNAGDSAEEEEEEEEVDESEVDSDQLFVIPRLKKRRRIIERNEENADDNNNNNNSSNNDNTIIISSSSSSRSEVSIVNEANSVVNVDAVFVSGHEAADAKQESVQYESAADNMYSRFLSAFIKSNPGMVRKKKWNPDDENVLMEAIIRSVQPISSYSVQKVKKDIYDYQIAEAIKSIDESVSMHVD